MAELSEDQKIEVEAAAYRRLVRHLSEHPEVQNIDLMNLAGFCRNCLARWYQEAAQDLGVPIEKAAAREIVYGMPYEAWREQHQTPATVEAVAAFKNRS